MRSPRQRPRSKVLQGVATKPTSLRNAIRLGIALATLAGIVVIALSVLPLLRPGAPSSFSFSVSIPQYTQSEERSGEDVYTRFAVPSGTATTDNVGKPELPKLTERVAIPCGANNVAVTAAGSAPQRATTQHPIFPVPRNTPRTLEDGTTIVEPVVDPDEAFYASAGVYPRVPASVAETVNLRGVCYATLSLFPYRYDPSQHVLFSDSRLAVTVTWTNPATVSVTPNTLGRAFDGVLGTLNVRNLPENLGAAVTASSEQGEMAAADGTVQYVTNLLVGQEPAPPVTNYLIVASDDLFDNDSAALRQLADFRSQAAYGGYNVSVIRMSDVLTTVFPDEEQGRSYTNDEKLKLFLRYVYTTWNGAELPPSFVTLVGDGDGTAGTIVPVHLSRNGEYGSSYPVPADFWYTTNFDDAYPQYLDDSVGRNQIGSIAVGRLPVKTEAELQRVVDKIVQFEAVAPSQPGAWRSQTGMYSGFKKSEWVLYHTETDNFFNTLKDNALTPHSVETFSQYRKNTGDGNDDASRRQYHDAVVSDMQSGRIFLVNASHGSINTWSDGTAYQSVFAIADIPNLNNADRPPIVFALACSTAAFETTYTDSLGEAFLKNSDDGAVGYIGASQIVSIFSHTVMTEAVQQALNVQKLQLGTAVLAGKNAETDVGLRLSYNYFGDPALNVGAVLQMSTGNPDLTGSPDSYTMSGRQVTVRARVQNAGFTNASSVPVDVYNGDPRSGGIRLTPSSIILPAVDAGATVFVDAAFTMPAEWTESTQANLYLSVDQNGTITELNESNNTGGPLQFLFSTKSEAVIANGASPSASATSLVYKDTRNDVIDIFAFDRTTNTERRVTNDTFWQFTPSISGTTVVWEDTRNGGSDIYRYDLATNVERRLTTNVFDQISPAISGTTVVWEDWRNGNADIYSYDLASGTERRLTTNTATQTTPAISGTTVVWEDWRNGNADIYSYDLATGTERRITTDVADQTQPTVSDRGIAWADHRSGSYDIYYDDFLTSTERRITTDVADQTQPVLAGDRLAWIDARSGNPDVYTLENGADGLPGTADDGTQLQLTDNPSIRSRQSITLTGTTAYYSGNDGVNRVYRVELDAHAVPTATNRDGVLAGNSAAWIAPVRDLGAAWVRVNHDLDGAFTPDLSVAKAYLDAGTNVVLTVSNRNPSNIDDPNGEFASYPGAGFPFPDTPEGKQRYQQDVQNVLTQLAPYLASGRTIFVQAENEVVDATIFTTSSYWRGTLAAYLRLLDAFAEKARSVDPAFTVVLSSFTNSALEFVTGPATDPQYPAAYALLTTMLGQSGSYDAVDLHLYGCPEDIAAKVAWVRERMPSDKRWISTEDGGPMQNYCGYPVQGRSVDWNNSDELAAFETEQASQVTRRMRACAQNGGSVCLWFSLFDLTGSGDAFSHLGLLTQEATPREKEAFTAFQTYAGQQTNVRPTLTPIGSKEARLNTTLTFTVLGADADGNTLTYRASPLPAGATFANQTFTWTPNDIQPGTYTIRFTVSDGALEAVEDVILTASGNRAPVILPIGSKSVFSGTTLTFTVTATDPDSDALTYSAVNLPSGATFANQTFTWTPNDSQAGTHVVRFSITDGMNTVSEDVTITVSVNTPPALSLPGDQEVDANAPVAFTVTATDPDSDPLALSATNLPPGSRFLDDGNGVAQFTWTPTDAQVGTHTITVTASDGRTTSNGTVRITVDAAQAANGNDNANLAVNNNANTNVGSNVNTNETVNTNTALNENVNRAPENRNTNTTPPPEDIVPPPSLPDPQIPPIPELSSNTANAAPAISAIPRQTAPVNALFMLIVTATDAEHDPLSFAATNVPFGATFTDQKDGTGALAWTPTTEQVGAHAVVVTVTDGVSAASSDVEIDVVAAGAGGAFPPSRSFLAFSRHLRGGFFLAAGDVRGDVRDEIVVGTGEGFSPEVRVYSNDGTLRTKVRPFPKRLRGGVRVASCDLDADGRDELLVAPGPGYAPLVRRYALTPSPRHVRTIWALDGKSANGLQLACGDLDGDGRAEIIAGASRGSGHVTVHRADGKRIASFFPFGKRFRGGITLAAGDLDGDGRAEILTGKETGGTAVRYFAMHGKRLGTLPPFTNAQEIGTSLAAGDLDGDSRAEILVARTGSKTQPAVRVFTARGTRRIREFFAYAGTYRSGLRLAAGDLDGDSTPDIITIPAARSTARIGVFDALGVSAARVE